MAYRPALVTPAEAVAELVRQALADEEAEAQAITTDGVRTGAVQLVPTAEPDGRPMPDAGHLGLAVLHFESGRLSVGDSYPIAGMDGARVVPPSWPVLIRRDQLLAFARQQRDQPATPPRETRPREPWREVAAIELAAWLHVNGMPGLRAPVVRYLLESLAEQGMWPDQRTVERWLRDEAMKRIQRRVDESS